MPTSTPSPVQPAEPVWQPDCGDGRYRNPILHADYSDPDVIRVGPDYYLVSSSFTCVPGLPLLHSRDLVNWRLINHALPTLVPHDHFSVPRHGQGVWAPALRHHAGKFWIYYPDPDFGLYVITADHPAGRWSEPVLVKAGKGLIDPCPLWDDDGRVYLVHGWAKSRSGLSNILTLLRLSPDGRKVDEDLGIVVDGGQVPVPNFRTLEGPKFYRHDNWYYLFAPAGGVATGWQSVFRSKKIRGPYEHRIVLAQGNTQINGPHQGGLVDTPDGAWWFVHFQDKKAYGRVVHLQPVVWRDDWPVIGHDPDGDNTGEPVMTHDKPVLTVGTPAVPATSDEFDFPQLGLQWQWQGNPVASWSSLAERPGFLRLRCQPEPHPANLYRVPNLLLQKFPAPSFSATTTVQLHPQAAGDAAGLLVFGYDYAWIGLQASEQGFAVIYASRKEASTDGPETRHILLEHAPAAVRLRIAVREGGLCRFAFSMDGTAFTEAKEEFIATCGHWVGAKIGLFASSPASATTRGEADFDWFRVQPLQA
ncbi:MAG TPA: glycoside hydrolase 43 family protein [Lacunisphaera sp.]|nr:glycoside hydrolase 43 family protein [Lacunisphaera sp.]